MARPAAVPMRIRGSAGRGSSCHRSRSTSASPRCFPAARRRCGRSRSATARPSARPGALRTLAAGADRRRADECADVAATALCGAGRHLVATVRGRGVRSIRSGGDRRRHRRAAGRPGHPRLAEGAERAHRSAVTGMVVTGAQRQRPVRRLAAGSRFHCGPDARRRWYISGTGSVNFSGGRPRSTSTSMSPARSCSTATTSPPPSPARSRSAPAGAAGASRASSSSTRAASRSARRARPPPYRNCRCGMSVATKRK